MKKILFVLCLSLFSMFTCAVVNAAPVSVELPIVVVNSPSNETNYVTLESLNQSYPMPTNNQKMTIAINGSGEGKFGAITFTEPGYYNYKIYQKSGSSSNIKYDKQEYELTIQIAQEDGDVLRATVVMKKANTNIKLTVASFTNLSAKKEGKKKFLNPYTGDKIVKYFIISVVSLLLILILLIYINRSRDED